MTKSNRKFGSKSIIYPKTLPLERWVMFKGKWMHVFFDYEKTYINGISCEFMSSHIEKESK